MSDLKRKIRHLISGQIPEYIRVENPRFVSFLEEYYRFLDDGDGTDIGPNEILLSLEDWADVDATLEAFVSKMREQYAWDVPESTLINNRRLIKSISEYYESKGTENSVELFFKLMYDTSVAVRYPGEHILRASDGRWTQKKIIKLDNSKFTHLNPFDLKNKRIQLRYIDIVSGIGVVQPPPINTVVSDVLGTNNPHIFKLEVDIDPNTSFYDEASLIDLRGYFAEDYVQTGYIETTNIYMNDVDELIHVWYGSTEYGVLSRQVVGYTINSGGSLFKRGDLFFIDEQGSFGEYFAEDYVIIPNDYATNDVSNRVIIRVKNAENDATGAYVSEDYFSQTYTRPVIIGALDEIEVLATGHKFFTNDFDALIGNRRTGSTIANVTFHTGYILVLPKKFEGTQGLLSSVNKLQDNYYYQPYAYEIQTPIPMAQWLQTFTTSVHPAGLRVFSDLVIRGEADFGSSLEIEGLVA
jgi:hypothetical protein